MAESVANTNTSEVSVKSQSRKYQITQNNYVGATRSSRVANANQNLLLKLYGFIKRTLAK